MENHDLFTEITEIMQYDLLYEYILLRPDTKTLLFKYFNTI